MFLPKRNPPMKISMLMHFHACAEPFEPERARNSRAYAQFAQELLADGLIEPVQCIGNPGWQYMTTPKGRALVEAICAVPNPVAQWSIPK